MSAFDYARLRARLAEVATPVWPAERLAVIVDAHEQGVSYSRMAPLLGRGVSKNACISQARRIGLPQRGNTPTRSARPRKAYERRVAVAPRPPRPTKPPRNVVVREALALAGLSGPLISDLETRACRWPVGDPKATDFAFCGRPREGAHPYCAHHTCAAFQPAKKRRRGEVHVSTRRALMSGAWA